MEAQQTLERRLRSAGWHVTGWDAPDLEPLAQAEPEPVILCRFFGTQLSPPGTGGLMRDVIAVTMILPRSAETMRGHGISLMLANLRKAVLGEPSVLVDILPSVVDYDGALLGGRNPYVNVTLFVMDLAQ